MNYPDPSVLNDLTIVEVEDGLEFSAPAGTDCAAWLNYYNSTEELQKEFSDWIIDALQTRLEELQQHGSQD